jgi:glucan 1,3-beta-glucosidase
MPTLLATPNFKGLGLIDGSPYLNVGTRPHQSGYGSTNTFFRQIRNLVIDMTRIPPTEAATGIHWPTAQTTSLQNIVFKMSTAHGTQHQGLFIEEGSRGFMTDLIFEGGLMGFNVGNQQFTTRNLTFNSAVTAINQIWDCGWTYSGLMINNCSTGLNISSGGSGAVSVGSITLIDSEINNTPVGIVTARTDNFEPAAAGSLYLENVKLNNVGVAIAGPQDTYMVGTAGSTTITAWADGNRYLPQGPIKARGPIEPSKRPAELLDATGRYYTRSKPQYDSVLLSSFLSVRDLGATGDGLTDDTLALNAAFACAQTEGKILFVDAGYYKVTSTIRIPPGSKIVGEALASVILSSDAYFNDLTNPKPVVQVGRPGEQGTLEWSDMFVSTQGEQKGAVLIEYNLDTPGSAPAGMWDVHTRIGGFAGSNLQTAQCKKTPDTVITVENLKQECIAAYMAMHVTKSATGLYMENNWLWTADHDLDDARNNNTQLTIYAGRGLYVESKQGIMWL